MKIIAKIKRYYKRIKPSKAVLIITSIFLLITLFYILNTRHLIKNSNNLLLEDAKITEFNKTPTIPTFVFPLRYFSSKDFSSGNLGDNGDYDDYSTWESSTYSGMDTYHSFPTKIISLNPEDYSNESIDLPPLKSVKHITEGWMESFQESFKKEINKYGKIATRFLPDDDITNLEKFDVDGDGKPETIISTCSNGGNHCPHEIIIVKNNKIIFSVSPGITDNELTKSDTGNGFYVNWTPVKNGDRGFCCPISQIRTRFVYEKGKFIPVYEQKVIYFDVNNADYSSK